MQTCLCLFFYTMIECLISATGNKMYFPQWIKVSGKLVTLGSTFILDSLVVTFYQISRFLSKLGRTLVWLDLAVIEKFWPRGLFVAAFVLSMSFINNIFRTFAFRYQFLSTIWSTCLLSSYDFQERRKMWKDVNLGQHGDKCNCNDNG